MLILKSDNGMLHFLAGSQEMILSVLMVGALLVMDCSNSGTGFTVGMPVLRLVGLWQKFQQANIVVKRLGERVQYPALYLSALRIIFTRRLS